MNKECLEKICVFCLEVNDGEALNGDDIEEINNALKKFNGDEE